MKSTGVDEVFSSVRWMTVLRNYSVSLGHTYVVLTYCSPSCKMTDP